MVWTAAAGILIVATSVPPLLFGLWDLPMVLATSAAFLLPIILTWQALNSEWQGQTHHLLLSLPLRGRTVLGAKLLAISVHVAVLCALLGPIVAMSPANQRVVDITVPGGSIGSTGRLTAWFFVEFLITYLWFAAATLLAFVFSEWARRQSRTLAVLVYVGVAAGGWAAFHPFCSAESYRAWMCEALSISSGAVMISIAVALWDRSVEA